VAKTFLPIVLSSSPCQKAILNAFHREVFFKTIKAQRLAKINDQPDGKNVFVIRKTKAAYPIAPSAV